MPTDLTPDLRRRLEDAVGELETATTVVAFAERHEERLRRQERWEARTALITTVAALVSEAEERERADTVMACVDVVREVYPAGRNRARAVDAMRRIGDPFAARATAKPPEVE